MAIVYQKTLFSWKALGISIEGNRRIFMPDGAKRIYEQGEKIAGKV